MRRVLIIGLIVAAVLVLAYFVFNFFYPIVKVDAANSCGWENGKIISSTHAPSKIESQRMSRSAYSKFFQTAQFNFKCILGNGLR